MSKKEKEAPQIEEQQANSNEGHNKPPKNPALLEQIETIEKLEQNKKDINNVIRETKNKVKEEHGYSLAALNHELKMRRLNLQTRKTIESEIAGIQDGIGYQYAMELHQGEAIDPESDPVEVGKQEAKKNKIKAVK